jgi:hypothetical protein
MRLPSSFEDLQICSRKANMVIVRARRAQCVVALQSSLRKSDREGRAVAPR